MVLQKYSELSELRKVDYENVDFLMWIKTDTGAFGNESDGPLCDWIQGHKEWLQNVRSFDTVIQAGGNCGMYARFYKNYFKNVWSFEPCPKNFYCLQYNCQGEGFHIFEAGLGDKECKLSIKNDNKTNVGTHKILDKPGDVQIITIDSLNLSKCDLIHLDIEGYESKALSGAVETINKFQPVIILERGNGKNIIEPLGYTHWKKFKMDSVFLPKTVIV